MTEETYAVLIIEFIKAKINVLLIHDVITDNNPKFLLICGNRRKFVAKDSFFLPKINNPR